MSAEDLERYETEIELALFSGSTGPCWPIVPLCSGDGKALLPANDVRMEARGEGPRTYFEVKLADAWVWDMYRPARSSPACA